MNHGKEELSDQVGGDLSEGEMEGARGDRSGVVVIVGGGGGRVMVVGVGCWSRGIGGSLVNWLVLIVLVHEDLRRVTGRVRLGDSDLVPTA